MKFDSIHDQAGLHQVDTPACRFADHIAEIIDHEGAIAGTAFKRGVAEHAIESNNSAPCWQRTPQMELELQKIN